MKTAHKWVLGILSFLLLGLLFVSVMIYAFFTSATGRTMLADMGIFKPPHSKRIGKQESIFFINFETKSDDNLQWGAYCSRLLYDKIRFTPDEILYLPSLEQTLRDMDRYRVINVRNSPLPHEGELFLARAYGVEHVLHGTVYKQGEQIRFEGILYKVDTDSPLAAIQESGSINDPAAFIKKLGFSTFHVLNVSLSQEQQKVLKEPICNSPQAFLFGLQAFSQPDEQSPKAVELYKQAYTTDTNFIFAYIGAASRAGGMNEAAATQIMWEALGIHPKEPNLRLFSFEENVSADYMKFLMDYPDNQEALWEMADHYYEREDYESALPILKYAEKIYPNNWFIQNDLGYVSFKIAMQLHGNNSQGALSPQAQSRYTQLTNQANAAFAKAVELSPNNPIVLCNLMNWGIELNQPEQTILDYFTRATTVNPHIKADWDTLAILYRPEHLNQPEKLHNLYAHCLKENPRYLDVAEDMMYRINYYAIQNRNRKMVSDYQKDTAILQLADAVLYDHVTANPQDDYTRYMAAEGFYYVMDSVHSWKYYEQIKVEPPPTAHVAHEYFLHKGQIACLMNQQDTALHYLELCFQNSPCDICGPNACIIKAGILLDRKNMDEGFALLEKAIQWNPKKVRSYWSYAYYAAEYKTHLDQGFRYAQKAVEMEPDNANYWATLANIYYLQKDKVKAQEAIKKALQLDSSQSWIQDIKKKISKMS